MPQVKAYAATVQISRQAGEKSRYRLALLNAIPTGRRQRDTASIAPPNPMLTTKKHTTSRSRMRLPKQIHTTGTPIANRSRVHNAQCMGGRKMVNAQRLPTAAAAIHRFRPQGRCISLPVARSKK